MSNRFWKLSFAAAAAASVVALIGSDLSSQREALVVHEWGTLTSVANERGEPAEWASLPGTSDLPCFVARLGPGAQGSYKFVSGLVRMETPVLYFYPQKRTTLSVHVDFPQGWITEWYPNASAVKPTSPTVSGGLGLFRGGSIQWDSVDVSPGEHPQLPLAKGASHYFAARETDSAAVSAGGQNEKLLFYRGIGSFQVPLRPKFTTGGRLEIANSGTEAIPLAIVFENRGGRIGYQTLRNIQSTVTVDPLNLTASIDQRRQELGQELARDLVEFGLYPKEASAMIETWRDSWFEEGSRVFYIYPRAAVDARLPLTIAPAPSSLARVFVGRAELFAPWMDENINSAIARGAAEPLVKYGRFLDSFLTQIHRTEHQDVFADAAVKQARTELQRSSNAAACVK